MRIEFRPCIAGAAESNRAFDLRPAGGPLARNSPGFTHRLRVCRLGALVGKLVLKCYVSQRIAICGAQTRGKRAICAGQLLDQPPDRRCRLELVDRMPEDQDEARCQ